MGFVSSLHLRYIPIPLKTQIPLIAHIPLKPRLPLRITSKASEASFHVAYTVAKDCKNHTIAERLIKPAAKEMVRIMLGDKAASVIDMVSLSNNTISRRIASMAQDVEDKVISGIAQSSYLALQFYESVDVANESELMVFVRYINNDKVVDEFLLCQCLASTTTGDDVFKMLDTYIKKRGLQWTNCVGVSTDGAPSMIGVRRGAVTRVKQGHLWLNPFTLIFIVKHRHLKRCQPNLKMCWTTL
jgi:hypothetical protein